MNYRKRIQIRANKMRKLTANSAEDSLLTEEIGQALTNDETLYGGSRVSLTVENGTVTVSVDTGLDPNDPKAKLKAEEIMFAINKVMSGPGKAPQSHYGQS